MANEVPPEARVFDTESRIVYLLMPLKHTVPASPFQSNNGVLSVVKLPGADNVGAVEQ